MANGPKLLSGRVPVVPLDQLTGDRYQYLSVAQAEPNLGNGVANSILTIQSNGNRVWANSVTLTTGSFSGNVTAANFIGNITGNITAPGSDTQILFNDGGIVAGNAALTFNKSTSLLTVTGDSLITGNLTVNGNTNYINVTNLNIQDPIIGIGRGPNNAPLVSNDNKDRGEQLWYYTSSEKSAFIGYDNSAANLILATDVSITNEIVTVNNYGNVTVGNISGQFIVASANVNANNLIASSNISATGNISANYYSGNGYYLTGIITSVANINNGTSNVRIDTAGGNILANVGGVANVFAITTVGANVDGTFGVTGNITGGNLTTAGTANIGTLAVTGGASIAGNVAGNLNVTGNIAGGNITTPGLINATGNITATANISGGNIVTAGLISATGNITGGNLTTAGTANVGTLSVTGSGNVTGNLGVAGNVSSGNSISTLFNSINTNLSLPGPGNTAAERLRIYGFNNPSETNYAIGVENGYIWTAVDLVSDSLGFKWYGSNTLSATLTSSGKFTAVSNITGGNLTTTGIGNIGTLAVTGTAAITGNTTVTANISGGNVVTAGLISATGNVTGGNLTTTGIGNIGTLAVTGTAAITGNTTVTANISGGNITTAGLISATGNITGGNLTTAGTANVGTLAVTGTSSHTGNASFGNISASGLANVTGNVIGGNLTTTGTANIGTLAVTGTAAITGNTTVTANISGGNITTAGLISATGNVTGGNLTTAGVINATGNISGGNIVSNGIVSTNNVVGSLSNVTVTAGSYVTTFDNTGNVTFPGNTTATSNVVGGNLTTTGTANVGTLAVTGAATVVGNATVTANIAGGNITTAGLITATGNVTGGNLTTTGTANVGTLAVTGAATITGNATVTANIAGGNITTAGLISATGNITSSANIAGNFVAAGSNRQVMFNDNGLISSNSLMTFDKAGPTLTLTNAAGTIITGYVSSLGGTDLSLTPGTSIVVSWANINPRFSNTYALGTSAAQWKNIWAGNANVGTLGATTFTATGNITGGNLTTAGIGNIGTLEVTGTAAITGNTTVTANISGGNIVTAGLISATGNITGGNLVTGGTANVTGNIYGNNLIAASNIEVLGNKISTGTTSGLLFEPGNVTLISGNIIVNGGYIYSQNGDTAIILVNNGEIGSIGIQNNLQVGKDGLGNLDVAGYANLTGALTVGGVANVAGNVIGGNLNTAGQVVATGNITGGNIITSGNVTSTGNIDTTGNVNAANVVTANINGAGGAVTIAASSGNYTVYLKPSGTGTVDANDARITNVGTPIQADDAATKQYVDDSVTAGIHIHQPVKYEQGDALTATYTNGGTSVTVDSISGTKTLTFTTSPALVVNDEIVFSSSFNGLTANTAYFVYSSNGSNQVTLSASYGGVELTGLTNGGPGLAQSALVNSGVGATLTNAGANVAFTPTGTVTPATVGDRVLVYNQGNAAINGVYSVTTVGAPNSPGPGVRWVFTRTLDADHYAPQDPLGAGEGDYFYITAGSGAGESYVLTAPIGPIIFGQSNITYTLFSASQIYSGANGVAINGQTISANVDNDTTAIVSGNIVVKAGANLTTPNIGAATGVSLTVTGNITANNIAANNFFSATFVDASANISGGNIISNGIANISGNLTASNSYVVGFSNVAGNLHALGNAHFGQDLSFVAAYANIQYAGTANSYLQLVAQNKDNGSAASTDFIATADNGTDADTYIDMGINSSAYNQPGYGLQRANDGYLYVAGNTATGGGNLVLSTLENNDIIFSTGGVDTGDEQGRFQYGNGFKVTGNIYSTGNVSGSWFIGNVSGNVSGNLIVSGPNTGVLFNDNGVANSTLGFTFDKTSNLATLTGNLSAANISTTGSVTATANVTGGNITTAGLVSATGNIAGGNLTTGGLVSATGNITGGNLTTTGTANVGTLSVTGSGNVTGNLGVTGNVSANYYIGNGYYLTGIITSVANINNGTSNVRIDSSGGNILANVGGVANVVVISSNALTVTGNIESTNGFFVGNGVYLTGVVAASSNSTGVTNINYGTSNVRIDAPDGNILANVGGVANVFAITTAGANVTGTLGVTGNITGGNLTTAGTANIGTLSVTGSGNVSGNLGVTGNVNANYYLGNGAFLTGVITSVANINNGTSNVRIDASGGNILANVGGVANVFAITTVGANVTGNLDATSNISASYFLGNGSQLTGISTSTDRIFNGTSNVRIDSSGGNILANVGGVANVFAITTVGANVDGTLGVTGNITGGNLITTGTAAITGNATVTANISGGNITTAGLISATGNITATANIAGGNITTAGLISATGNITATANIAGGNITTAGLISATGNITGGNLTTTGTANVGTLSVTGSGNVTGNLGVTGNVSANYFLGNGSQLTGINVSTSSISNGTSNVSIPVVNGNVNTSVGGTANVFVVTTAGANVTGNLGVSSNVSAAYFLGNANATSLTSGTVPSARLTGTYSINISGLAATANTVTDAAQPNITSVGTLSSLTVSGNVSGGNLTTGGLISATGNITGGNITTAGLIKGTDQLVLDTGPTEGAQIVLAWNGILGLTGQANGTWNIDVDSSNSFRTFYQNASGQTAVPFTLYSGNSLAQFSSNVSASYFFGNGSQLTGIVAAAGSNITNGTSNVSIPVTNGNVNTSVGGTANVLVVTSTGANVAGTFNATGNIVGGNLTTTGIGNIGTLAVTGNATVTANIAGGNITTAGLISATGNITGGNLTTTGIGNIGTLSVTGTAAITGNATVTANIAGGNITTAGLVSATGNVTGGNLTTTGIASIGTLNVTGDGLISGNLTVNGNTNYINVTNLNVQDPIIGIGRGANNAPLTTNDNKDRGEQLWYYSGSEKSSFIGYDNSAGNLIAAVDVSIASEVVTVNSYGNFVVGTLAASTVNSTGTINATGNVTGGNVTTGGNISGTYLLGNGYYMSGIATLSTVYYQLQVQGNVTGNSLGNSTLTASNSSGILYPRSGNGITMSGNATSGVLTISITGSTNDGTFWANNEDCGLVTASLDAPSVDNGLVTDSVTSAYDLGAMDFAANYSSIASDVLPATTNTYVIGNSSLSWKSIYADGNITTANGYFIGNGALLTGISTSGGAAGNLSNGTSSIAIATANGNATVSIAGNSNVVVFSQGVTTYNANVVPAANATYNLGSASLQWNSLYVAGNTIYLGNISLKAGAGNSLGIYGADGSTPGAVLSASGFSYNAPNISTNGNISNTYNALSSGPITINNNITVTVDNGATWSIV